MNEPKLRWHKIAIGNRKHFYEWQKRCAIIRYSSKRNGKVAHQMNSLKAEFFFLFGYCFRWALKSSESRYYIYISPVLLDVNVTGTAFCIAFLLYIRQFYGTFGMGEFKINVYQCNSNRIVSCWFSKSTQTNHRILVICDLCFCVCDPEQR